MEILHFEPVDYMQPNMEDLLCRFCKHRESGRCTTERKPPIKTGTQKYITTGHKRTAICGAYETLCGFFGHRILLTK